jgi:hypothetical protein
MEMKKIIIDYLSFSIKPKFNSEIEEDNLSARLCYSPYSLTEGLILNYVLGLSDYKDSFVLLGGHNGYKNRLSYQGIDINMPSENEFSRMGYFVAMSGDGCRFYENAKKQADVFSWEKFFDKLFDIEEILGYKIKICRIDLAVDDFTGALSRHIIEKHINEGNIVTTSRRSQVVENSIVITYNGKGQYAGYTRYIGSRNSDRFVRIYDKLAEQKRKGAIFNSMFKHWYRFEIEYKDAYAMRIVNAIRHLGSKFAEFWGRNILEHLRFVDERKSNASRSQLSEWWTNFVGAVSSCTLGIMARPVVSIGKMLNYTKHRLAPTLYTLIKSMGVDDFIKFIEKNGKDRLTQRHLNALNGAQGVTVRPDDWFAQMPLGIAQI